MSTVEPGEAHLRLLRNLESRQHVLTGFIIEENGLKAYFECIRNDWVCRGQLTAAGREMLRTHPIVPQRVACVVLSATVDPTRKSE